MNLRHPIPAAVALLSAMLVGAAAQAAPTVYQGVDSANGTVPSGGDALAAYNAFLGATSGERVENFESAALGRTGASLSIFGGTGTLEQDANARGEITNTSSATGPGRFNTAPLPCAVGNTAQCRWFETYQSFVVTLGSAVSAFGFFDTDLGDNGGALTLTFLNGNTTVATQAVPNSNERGVGFFGFVDGAILFDRVRFTVTQTNVGADLADYIGFDGLVRATADANGNGGGGTGTVPVPATLALVLAGLGAMRALRRR